MKKNFILITSDQQRWDTLGVLNSKIKTPNLDRMCKMGILYDRAYTANPVCTPARISMLTGHYPSKHGCYTIGTSLEENYDTVPKTFADHGYFTALIGKAHFRSCLNEESFEAEPSIMNEEFFKQWTGPYHGFEHVKLVIGHSVEPHACGMHYGLWLREQGVDTKKYFGNHEYTDFGVWNLEEQYSGSAWTYEETKNAIDHAVEREQPFYIWSSFQDPHNPCFAPQNWADQYQEEDMPVYDKFQGECEEKPFFYKHMIEKGNFGLENEMGGKDWHCVSNLPDMDKEKKRSIMKYYYAMVSQMDKYIGKILDYLEEKDLVKNTVIVFTSDHGDYMGNHGLWWKGIPAYEDIQKIPFIVCDPEVETKNTTSHAIQSSIDIPTTFLAYAGLKKVGQQGVNQMNSWRNNTESCRDNAIVEFRPSESSFMQKTFVTDQYKLIVYSNTAYGELYDLSSDPNQLANLWDKEEYKNILLQLMKDFVSAEMYKDGVLQERLSPA